MVKNMQRICFGQISPPSCSFYGELHFFKVKLQVDENGDRLCLSLSVEKDAEKLDTIVLLVETKISIGATDFFLDKDLWSKTEELWSTAIPTCRGNIRVETRLCDILPTTNLSNPSKLRKTQILCYNSIYYVDVERLVDIGGYLFLEWKKRKEEGHNRIVETMDKEELKTLLDAVMAHDFIVVHRRNFLQLCEVGEKYRILSLLRAVEQYLMDAHIHPMRRLEFSVELRMARLYDFGIREMGSPHEALRKLHEYLAVNGETMNDVHPKLLSALNINPEYICIS